MLWAVASASPWLPGAVDWFSQQSALCSNAVHDNLGLFCGMLMKAFPDEISLAKIWGRERSQAQDALRGRGR